MKKEIHDPHVECDHCFMKGMSFRRVDIVKVIFIGRTEDMLRHYHVCENCGNEFRTDDERSINLRIRMVMLKYFQKFEEL